MRNGEREREKRGETVRDSEWRSGAQGGREEEEVEAEPPAKSLLTLNSRVCQPLL